jgi:hypothetical protein
VIAIGLLLLILFPEIVMYLPERLY